MAKRGGFPGGGMPGNMNNLMKQAQRMQRQMEEKTKEMEEKEWEATAGGGAVTVKISGKKEVLSVKLDPEVVDPDDIEMLEDLIVAATNEALRKVEEESAEMMSALTGGLGEVLEVYSKMDFYSSQISNLVEQLSHLPGIGSKSAQRLAFHILNMSPDQVKGLADAMTNAKKNVRYCKECCTYTDDELCPICANPKRNHKQIMVVENTRDLAAYEKTGKYEGVYHVLHGAISPMAGISPQDIRLSELMVRLQKDVDEVIVATNKTLEGDTTATYISKLIKPLGIKVSRIASGVPIGGDLEYIDEITLYRALEGRTDM